MSGRKLLSVAAAVVIPMVSLSPALGAEKMTLRADSWCPYNCDPASKNGEGFLVDMMREIFREPEFTIDYDLAPWTQAVGDARTGKFNGVIAVAESDSAGLIHTKKAQIISITCAYGLKS